LRASQTCRVTAGGMTKRMTRPTHEGHRTRATFRSRSDGSRPRAPFAALQTDHRSRALPTEDRRQGERLLWSTADAASGVWAGDVRFSVGLLGPGLGSPAWQGLAGVARAPRERPSGQDTVAPAATLVPDPGTEPARPQLPSSHSKVLATRHDGVDPQDGDHENHAEDDSKGAPGGSPPIGLTAMPPPARSWRTALGAAASVPSRHRAGIPASA
jgi:hypothetical protein